MNRVILMGRLTRDPEVRYTQGERSMAVARYTLAVDRRGARKSQDGNEQTADFINIVAFDRAGEFAEKYFRQGMRVLVSGRIQTGSYTKKKVSVFIPQISSQMIRNLLIVKMRPLEENRHQKWESRSVMALCQYRMA